jgi:hypothetical protein
MEIIKLHGSLADDLRPLPSKPHDEYNGDVSTSTVRMF